MRSPIYKTPKCSLTLNLKEIILKTYLDFSVDKARDAYWFLEKIRWFQFIFALILQVGLLWMSINLWLNESLTVGEFTMVTSLSLLIINDARRLAQEFLNLFEYMGNISDGVSIMIKNHEIIDEKKAPNLKVSKGSIHYKDVCFKYAEGKEVFEKLNLNIRSGERVGLVGYSGSGKSTFVNLMTRLYDIQDGKITIDEQNIAKVTQDSLREQISMIPQDPMLFHRSLMENIRYGRIEASDEEVSRCSQTRPRP